MIWDGVFRITAWVIGRVGAHTIIIWCCLVLILASMLAALGRIVRGLDIPAIALIIALGMLAGWVLASPRRAAWKAIATAAVMGIGLAFLLAGALLGKLYSLALVIAQSGWATLHYSHLFTWTGAVDPPDHSLVALVLLDFLQNVRITLEQIGLWGGQLVQGTPLENPIAITLIWSLAIWACCIWLAWFIRRKNQPLIALLPLLLILLSGMSYTRTGAWLLMPIMASTILLLAFCGFCGNEGRWKRLGIDYAEDLRSDTLMYAILITILLIGASFVSAAFSLSKVIEFARSFQPQLETQPLGPAFGLQPGEIKPAPGSQPRIIGDMPRLHLLGAAPELLRTPVMVVRTDDLLPDPPSAARNGYRQAYYWRAVTYDYYTGHGWATSPTEDKTYRSNQLATDYERPYQRLVRISVEPLGVSSPNFFSAGQVVTVDQDYTIFWRSQEDAIDDRFNVARVGEGAAGDPRSSGKPLAYSGGYQVEALVPEASQELLRQAGTDYPETIRGRYLQLPAELPDRVQQVARAVTDYYPAPYDKALAIQNYLRQYPYSLDVPEPPRDRDVSDYFLFDLKDGSCDYFATTMVVLARSAGIPARLVTGYAAGEYDIERGGYLVREADAHSWAEIYFPGIGWVEFEPTPTLPVIQRPETIPGEELIALAAGVRDEKPRPVGWITGGAVLLALGLAAWWMARRQRTDPVMRIAGYYRGVYRQGRRLGVTLRPSNTPEEFSNSLQKRLRQLMQRKRLLKTLDPANQDIHQLVGLYEEAIYSANPPDAEAAALGRRTWKGLRWRLWLAHFGRRGL